jgi:hypothetical protein
LSVTASRTLALAQSSIDALSLSACRCSLLRHLRLLRRRRKGPR